jgi:hypothetical protein
MQACGQIWEFENTNKTRKAFFDSLCEFFCYLTISKNSLNIIAVAPQTVLPLTSK